MRLVYAMSEDPRNITPLVSYHKRYVWPRAFIFAIIVNERGETLKKLLEAKKDEVKR